jgi:hypothetical protein
LENNVKEITIMSGVTLRSFDEIKGMTYTHFADLYTEKDEANLGEIVAMLDNILTIISQSENDSLTQEIIKGDSLKSI